MSDRGGWVSVYYTNDGPSLEGPFDTREEAHREILEFYKAEFGLDEGEAEERYETSPNEWVARLSEQPKRHPLGPRIEATETIREAVEPLTDDQERAVRYLQEQRELTHERERAAEADDYAEVERLRLAQNALAEAYLTANREAAEQSA